MKRLIVLLFVVAAANCFAQRQNVYYLKNDERLVNNLDSADFIRVVSEPDSGSQLYNVKEVYTNKVIKFLGKSSTADYLTLQGQAIKYSKQGRKSAMCTYLNNRLIGDEYLYYPNGKLYLHKMHPSVSKKDITPLSDVSYQIVACYDSLGNTLIIDGNGYYKAYDENSKVVSEEGPVINGKANGNWKGETENNVFAEEYVSGELKKGTVKFKDGSVSIYTKYRKTRPDFKGGLNDFYKYLGKSIHYPSGSNGNRPQGRVIVGFFVEADGRLTEIQIVHSAGEELDTECLRVVSQSPEWIPGTLFGRNIRAFYTVPIQFITK